MHLREEDEESEEDEDLPYGSSKLLDDILDKKNLNNRKKILSEDERLQRLNCPKCGSPLKWDKTEIIYEGEKLYIECDYCKSEIEIQL